MKPVRQRTDSDCHAACVASIMEIGIEKVPKCFHLEGWDEFKQQRWLKRRGITQITVRVVAKGRTIDAGLAFLPTGTYCILSMPHTKGGRSTGHSVVARYDNTGDVHVVFDPGAGRPINYPYPPRSITFLARVL